MKKYLLACGLIVAASAPIFAQNSGVSLIREDRVWEYRQQQGGDTRIASCLMKFEGTREINGQTYHRFIPVEKSITTLEGDVDNETLIYTREETPFRRYEKLLREEDGKVYVLHEDFFQALGHALWEHPDDWTEDTHLVEYLLYDFNIKEGESFDAIGGMSGVFYSKEHDFDFRYMIDSVKEVKIDGETCRLQFSKGRDSDYENDLIYRPYDTYFLEGIGFISWCASMTYIPLDYTPGMGDDWYTLARVYNDAGEIIFPVAGAEYPLNWKSVYIPDEYGVTVIGPSDSVKGINADSTHLSYSGGIVRVSDGAELTVYDMSGKRVAQGRGSLSTASLQPGVYIVKSSGATTLKITVK